MGFKKEKYATNLAFVCMAFLLLQIGVVSAAAPAVYDFRLIQAEAKLPGLRAYVDVTGVNDLPAKGIDPTLFKGKLADKPVTVKKVTPFEESGEGIAYILLVDVSKSLTAEQFRSMKETLNSFVDSMSDKDQAALITYGSQVKVLQEYTRNKGAIRNHLTQLSRADDDTAYYAALEKGLSLAKSAGAEVPRYRVVITLTDGVNDLSGGATKADIQNLLSRDPVPLYLVGFLDGKPTVAEEKALADMKDFARISGGRYYDGRGRDWRGIYFSMVRSIRNAFVLDMDVPDLKSEGQPMTLEMSLAAANKTWNEKLAITVPASGIIAEKKENGQVKPKSSEEGRSGSWIYVAAGVLIALGLAIGAWIWLKGRRAKESLPEDPPAGTFATPPGAPAPSAPPPSGPPSSAPAAAAIDAKLPDTATEAEAVQDANVVGLMVRLTRTHEGPPPNQIDFELSERVVLGNDPARSHLVFDGDPVMAGAHCSLLLKDGYVYVEDIDGNITQVNGVAVSGKRRLEEQDILNMGQTEMRITFPL
jgi:Mg-chelatase subunit ChlD